MNEIERKLLECFVAQVKFERDGVLQDLWNKKLEVEELLNPTSTEESACDMEEEVFK